MSDAIDRMTAFCTRGRFSKLSLAPSPSAGAIGFFEVCKSAVLASSVETTLASIAQHEAEINSSYEKMIGSDEISFFARWRRFEETRSEPDAKTTAGAIPAVVT